ncbi:uncharacterized protein LOC110030940 isoform X2 [Phalaenopsis equestris]|uniref:uncharacterized protein LOC110030940 isoform X2 n=1 Tax=Phalaenopsis equestris TaxID=78828 RepID=UPI0009E2F86D|nr:uncharacterized protein LOC110030940 isoform X2 [Phalaenopsis equestris]
MAFGVFSPSLFKPFLPPPTPPHKALFLPSGRDISQANSITATKAGDYLKFLCPLSALLHHEANCIMEAPIHIFWQNLFSGKNFRVIYGYWMSPDLEDGWGFVEAFVDQILSV